MPVRSPDGWFLSGPNGGVDGVVALLSLEGPASQEGSAYDWIEIEEQIDGMDCNTLHAIILKLAVPPERLNALIDATDSSDRAWRKDLSWHNTAMDTAADPTVIEYRRAIGSLGLAWTPPPGSLQACPLGIRLAQGAYPLDPTDENLHQLGIRAHVKDLLGREPDPALHSIALLCPGDD
jgi:hypothetical protein